ncbi:MAG TPA: hypothetical protein VG188_11460 [Solirubrobacteraceae bacterium]|jgi:hypothetical protein|nr:hypothetical protein [Solirubrobacteraceae bacterium]
MDGASDFDFASFGPGDQERNRALAAIQELDGGWKASSTTLSFGAMRWRPDLQDGEQRALHLTLTGEIPGALKQRLRAAHEAGMRITVALGSRGVDMPTLEFVQAIDARIVAVDWGEEGSGVRIYRSVADWIATERISLAPDELRKLAEARLDAALAEPTNVKGRYYEETLCLVFSQVPWLTVEEHAYRNASEEIDLVLGIHATGHVAALVKGGVAVATAKNESTATGSNTVKYLKEQVANRKGRCTLGFLCSASTISKDARTEVLRGSQSAETVIVQLDLDDLRNLIRNSEELDQGLQRLIIRAVNA